MFKEALNNLRSVVTNRKYGRNRDLVNIRDLNLLLNDWDRLDQLVRDKYHENQKLKDEIKELKELCNKQKSSISKLGFATMRLKQNGTST